MRVVNDALWTCPRGGIDTPVHSTPEHDSSDVLPCLRALSLDDEQLPEARSTKVNPTTDSRHIAKYTVIRSTSLPPGPRLKAEFTTLSIRGGSGKSHKPLLGPPEPGPTRTLVEFKERTILETNIAIRQIIERAIGQGSLTGWIYAFNGQPWLAHDEHTQPIKIGQTRREVDERLAEIAYQCKYKPKRLFAYSVPHPGRYEALVHATLQNSRRRELGECPCGRRHQEWFAVDRETARSVVKMWACFAALEPYDERGLLKAEWKTWLHSDKIKMEDPNCWDRFVYDKFIEHFVDEFIKVRFTQRIARDRPGVIDGVVQREEDSDVSMEDLGPGSASLSSLGSTSSTSETPSRTIRATSKGRVEVAGRPKLCSLLN